MLPDKVSDAFSGYAPAYAAAHGEDAFIYFYRSGKETDAPHLLTRNQFLAKAIAAAAMLNASGALKGDRQMHGFGANHPLDLAFRLAAAMLGTVPVTINWQSDNAATVQHKIAVSQARFFVHGGLDADLLATATSYRPQLALLDGEAVLDAANSAHGRVDPLPFTRDLSLDDPKLVIFTSGTTGSPKGALHTYRSYQTNRLTFESFLQVDARARLAVVVVNPLHHANATAITDWALRRPATELHLFESYGTQFWQALPGIVSRGYDRIIAPLVSRHFDYFENLLESGRLGDDVESILHALTQTDCLLGSAPVGPTTVNRLRAWTGRPPIVRFGSTETCLQVMGTPLSLGAEANQQAFEAGWHYRQGNQPGYYIGRPHPPFTQVEIVASLSPESPDFMRPREAGQPGYLITRGANLMLGYLGDPDATAAVLHEGWYTGLRDIGYFLIDPETGARDFYWMGRDSAMLIRGGANYACEQIEVELKAFIAMRFDLLPASFDLAVVGSRLDSEHEDACCVTFQPLSDQGSNCIPELERRFLSEARTSVSKGARPDYLRIGEIPRNFKGAVQATRLKAEFEKWIKAMRGRQSQIEN